MKILSLDTAMAACSAAAIDTDVTQPLAASFLEMDRGHAEALPPMVAEVMRNAGLGFSQIDRIVVTTGPGTFTGVRIGLAFARGLGLARGIPVVGLDSLSAIAANEPAAVPLLVVSDARNDEVYSAILDAGRKLLRAPHITTVEAATEALPAGTMVLGTAARAAIAASGRNDLIPSNAGELPAAANFARVAASIVPGPLPGPLYLRAPDAKQQVTPLRKMNALTIEEVNSTASRLISELHSEMFDDGWSPASLADLLQTPGTEAAIASTSGEPLGFIITRRAADEAEIIAIGTRPSMQRRGIAQQLLARHMNLLSHKGVRLLFLEVAASNVAAQALYRASGFIEAGRRKGYYKRRDGMEDAIVMRRELSQ